MRESEMSRSGNIRKPFAWIAAGVLLQASGMFATLAAASDADDQWEFDATIYLWTPDIDTTTQGGSDASLSFNEIYKNLDGVFMGSFGGRKDKWSFLVDEVYMELSDSEGASSTEQVSGTTRNLDLDLTLKSSITTLAAGYNLVDEDGLLLDVIGGARYTWMEVKVKLKLNRTGGPLAPVSRRLKESDSDGNWDAIVGARGRYSIDDNWFLPYYADVGSGQSDLTWQALAGVGYKFGWGDVTATYRYLDYDFDSDYLVKDLTVKGPVFGATFRF
jgi:hypothetical protein